jgi:transposase
MTRKYTAFTKAFKLETLQLANQANVCIASLARDLGIRRNMIYKWRYQLNKKQDKAFKRTADNVGTSHHKATHSISYSVYLHTISLRHLKHKP